MTEETLAEIRGYVSNCFNAKHVTYSMSGGVQSGYDHLSKLMIEKYGLYHYDVDNVVGDIEDLITQYILESSPKFTDNDE